MNKNNLTDIQFVTRTLQIVNAENCDMIIENNIVSLSKIILTLKNGTDLNTTHKVAELLLTLHETIL